MKEEKVDQQNNSIPSTQISQLTKKSCFGPTLKQNKLIQKSQYIGLESNDSQILINKNFEQVQCEICNQQINRSFLQDHKKQCSQTFQYQDCEYCRQKIKKSQFQDHEWQCEDGLKEIPCQYCKELMVARFMNDHLPSCQPFLDKKYAQNPEIEKEEVRFPGSVWENCSICFLAMTISQPIQYLTCAHKFHPECIQEWLTRQNFCPFCYIEQSPS